MSLVSTLQKSVEEDSATIIYFQNDDCAPCRTLRPKVKELVDNKYPKLKLHLVNPVEEADVAAAFQVFSLPTILIFFEGKEFFRGGIYTSLMELDEKIERYYKMLFE